MRYLRSVTALAVLVPVALAAQQPPASAPAPPPAPPPPALEVGAVAPDFVVPGATRYGTLRNPVRLSDYKGKTVVLAFFFKARTGG
jgi:AhpC/TSA family